MVEVTCHAHISYSVLLRQQIQQILGLIVSFDGFFIVIGFLVFGRNKGNIQSLPVLLLDHDLGAWIELLVRHVEFLVFVEDDLMLVGFIQNLFDSLRGFFLILLGWFMIRIAANFRADVVPELIIEIILIHLAVSIIKLQKIYNQIKSHIYVEGLSLFLLILLGFFTWFAVEEVCHYFVSGFYCVLGVGRHEIEKFGMDVES